MGSKFELLLLPGIGLFMLFLIQFFERHPELHNYPQRFNQSNAEQFYLQSRKLANQLKNICLIIFYSFSIRVCFNSSRLVERFWNMASTDNSCWNFHTDCHWVDSTK